MSKKIVLLTLISVFLLSAMIVTSSAQPRIVGVNVGDWFKLDVTVNWSSNDTSATFPPPGWEWLEELNETEWVLISVEGIFDTNITLQATELFKNGSERIRDGWIDIDTGNSSEEIGETRDMTFMAISANLGVNDTVYTSVDYSTWKINETIVRTYPDEVRDTNHLNTTALQHNLNYSWNFYWDKPTGIIVETLMEVTKQTGEYLTTWSVLSRITESNVWVVPEFPTWTSMLLLLIVLTVAIAIYKRRLFKTPIY